jgi:hypothetical protein
MASIVLRKNSLEKAANLTRIIRRVQKAKNASANATMANTTVSIAAATKRKRSSWSGVSFHNMKPSCARGEDARARHKPT